MKEQKDYFVKVDVFVIAKSPKQAAERAMEARLQEFDADTYDRLSGTTTNATPTSSEIQS